MISLMLAGLALQAAAPTAAKPGADKKICRREIATGTIMGKSVCHTRAEWAVQDQADNARRDDFRDRTTNQDLPGGAGPGG